MTFIATIMEWIFGYNYCDGHLIEGCFQWCLLFLIGCLCEMSFF